MKDNATKRKRKNWKTEKFSILKTNGFEFVIIDYWLNILKKMK